MVGNSLVHGKKQSAEITESCHIFDFTDSHILGHFICLHGITSEEQRQSVVHELTAGNVVVLTALTLIENIVIGGKHLAAGEHFLRHVNGLGLHCVICADTVIDEISTLVKVVVLNELLNEVHILFNLEIAVASIVPARTAHGQEVADIVGIIAELQPRCHRAERESAEGSVVTAGFQIVLRGTFRIGVELSLYRRH